MKLSLGLQSILLIASVLIVFCRHDSVLATEPEDQQQQQPQQMQEAIAGQTLASVAADESVVSKFEQFKRMYQKHYSSVVEEMRRQVLFAASSFKAFVSQLRFRNKKSSSFQRVSGMSDWTPEEFTGTLMDAEDYYREMREALENQEMTSSEEVDADATDALQNEAVQGIGSLASYAKSSLSAMGDSVNRVLDTMDKAVDDAYSYVMAPKYEHRPDLPDEVFVDHRDDKCLNTVRSQGRCGSCYIFSTIALYEWAYCRLNKDRIEFAEQYPIDCGTGNGLNGCGGGFEMKVSKFVKKFGFERRENYEYKRKARTCVYNKDEIKADRMGALRMERPELSLVRPANLDKELLMTPLIITIYSPAEFHQYGGGVFEGQGCGTVEVRRHLHSVLLIGSGREDGHEYWIIRNSYGPFWGELGHLRLRKDSGCVADIVNGLKIKAMESPKKIGFNFLPNPKHDPRLVTWRSSKS